MNEQIRPNPELTARQQYSTLNTRSTMAQDGNNEGSPRQQRQPNRPNSEQPTQRLRVESIGEMMRTANPQAAREAARAIIDAAQASGQTLTPDQRRLVTELGYQPVLAGGADTTLNDDFNPEDEEAPVGAHGERGSGLQGGAFNPEEHEISQGEQRRMRQTDPRAHFSSEEIEQMIDEPLVREEKFNALFSRADTQPSRPFQEVFSSFYDEPIYNGFIENLQQRGQKYFQEGRRTGNAVMKAKGEELLDSAQRYILEYTYRGLIHDANYLIVANLGVEQMSGFMGRFSTEMADHAFRKRGVTPAIHFYEQALIKVREENNGYLPYDQVVANSETGRYSRVEELARKYFKNSLTAGFMKDTSGNLLTEMPDWEIDRAMAFARGLGIITGRFVEIAASSRLPKNQYISMWAHSLIGEIAPFRHLIGKFDIGTHRNRFLTFKLERKSTRWFQDELREVDNDIMFNVINNLVEDKDMRFIGKVNPFKIGGIVTKTGWRIAGNPEDEKKDDPLLNDTAASAIGKLVEQSREFRSQPGYDPLKDPFNWIGTGILIEKNRYDMSNPKKTAQERAKAERVVREQLIRTAKILPTRLLFNVREARAAVLKQFGSDAMTRPEFRNALDELIVVQEKAIQERSETLDFTIIENGALRNRAKEIADFIRQQYVGGGGVDTKLLTKLVGDFRDRDWKIPYIFGTEDTPWDQYELVRTGGRSIDRRWKDMFAETKAGKGVTALIGKMPFMKSPDQLLEALKEIIAPIEEYDLDIAQEVGAQLVEGLARFYSKDEFSKGKMGLGEVYSKITGKASFAQFAFGRGAMAWDELATHDFIQTARDSKFITDQGKNELMKKTRSQNRHVAFRVGEYAAIILLLMMLMRPGSEALKQAGTAR